MASLNDALIRWIRRQRINIEEKRKMKNHICKLGLIASLVMSVTTVAHASTNADITFHGDINKATCDVSVQGGKKDVDIGSFTKDDFPTKNTTVGGSDVVLDFGNCSGEDLATGGQMMMKASTAANQSSILTTNDLWGTDDSAKTNVGIKLQATNYTGTATALTPNSNTIALMDAVTDTKPANGLTIKPVTINAKMESIADKADIKAGTVTSAVTFSAVYN